MTRPLRADVAGGWYRTTARGHNRSAIFLNQDDRHHFLECLAVNHAGLAARDVRDVAGADQVRLGG